ncbi:MAG: 6-phosphofructokinase [Bacteroidales bacterium]|nr:6-phosphofructokinase [Bacteroidales bacterium]
MNNVFISFNLENDMWFIKLVHLYLKRQPGLKVFLYDQHEHGDRFDSKIGAAISEASYFVFFRGRKIGDYQAAEAARWFKLHGEAPDCHRLIVELPSPDQWPEKLFRFHEEVHPIKVSLPDGEQRLTERNASKCAAELARSINRTWIPYDGLPEKYIFDYEKDIIEQFVPPRNSPEDKYLYEGCPENWPVLIPRSGKRHDNPLKTSEIGAFRNPDDTVLVDVRSKYHKPLSSSPLKQKSSKIQQKCQICCLAEKGLTFLEAGPRKKLLHGLEIQLNVGILVTGGIAPGINAVIAGLIERHVLYWKEQVRKSHSKNTHNLKIHCYLDGFCGLLEGRIHLIEFAKADDEDPQSNRPLATILNNANTGGAVLGTSRYDQLSNLKALEKRNDALNSVLNKLWTDKIDILYVIGGDGSMKAAHALHTINESWLRGDPSANANARTVSIIGIPKTMDNDILWVWQSFGFMSAVEKASECLRLLHTESMSNPRLCVIQLFGSDSGFTVSHAALASLQCDTALIPEMHFNMEGLFRHIRKRLKPRLQYRLQHSGEQRSPYGMIVMAETAVPEDWYCYVNWQEHLQRIKQTPDELLDRIKDENLKVTIRKQLQNPKITRFTIDLSREEVEAIITFVENERRVYGQTPDALRTVSLRLVSQVLQYRIQNDMGQYDPYWKSFRVFTSEPRHLLRSSPPSANDIISGRRFGTLAVDNAMAGYSDFMISQWLTEYVLVPLSLVVLGRKRVPANGIFWKSVLAKTDQKEMS